MINTHGTRNRMLQLPKGEGPENETGGNDVGWYCQKNLRTAANTLIAMTRSWLLILLCLDGRTVCAREEIACNHLRGHEEDQEDGKASNKFGPQQYASRMPQYLFM
jgi:hypothetical protein